uniref:Ionotropic glutamate receptor C-terminal domain-containing protein n=1 Tax=Ditylenchus dipsaci TaxID=166011 RepID=A0A915DMA9_9BILA
MYLVAQVTPYEWNLSFSCCTAPTHPAAQYATNPKDTMVQLSNNYSFLNTLAVSTRLLGGTWWVFTLVIVSAYTANLAAVLTVSRPHIPIRSLDDLANQSTILYGTIKDGSTMQFFQESKLAHM